MTENLEQQILSIPQQKTESIRNPSGIRIRIALSIPQQKTESIRNEGSLRALFMLSIPQQKTESIRNAASRGDGKGFSIPQQKTESIRNLSESHMFVYIVYHSRKRSQSATDWVPGVGLNKYTTAENGVNPQQIESQGWAWISIPQQKTESIRNL